MVCGPGPAVSATAAPPRGLDRQGRAAAGRFERDAPPRPQWLAEPKRYATAFAGRAVAGTASVPL
jgi:hypothetical protein